MSCLYTIVAAMDTQIAAAQQQGSCALPSVLSEEFVSKYAAAHVVRAADLSEDDRKQFQQEHGLECPGLTTVNFYGDGKTRLAVILLDEHGAKTQLIWFGVSDRVSMTMSMARRRLRRSILSS